VKSFVVALRKPVCCVGQMQSDVDGTLNARLVPTVTAGASKLDEVAAGNARAATRYGGQLGQIRHDKLSIADG